MGVRHGLGADQEVQVLAAGGVYWVLAQAAERTLTKKQLLVGPRLERNDMARRLPLLLLLMLAANLADGATIAVRKDGTGDYTVIQQGLDAAANGDTILIGPGEYTESTMVRLPGWGYDIESFAHLRSDDLTIIGAGAEITVIGPTTYEGNPSTGSPAALSYSVGGGSLHVSDVGLRHCYGVYVVGALYMDRCNMLNNKDGLGWSPSGPGGWVRDSVFDVTEPLIDPMSFSISGGLGSNIELERCLFGKPASIRSVQGIVIRDCEMRGIDLYSGTQVSIYRSRFAGGYVGVSQSLGGGTLCEIFDSELSGVDAALFVTSSAPGGRFIVENSRLTGGSYGVLYSASGAGACVINNCDFVKGSGPMVYCAASATAVTHDLRNNYWGTTSEADIRSWIVDHTDNPSIGATVLYTPFAGQSVPTETTTWGDLKALFR
jgi:hypothetical protein